jgi:hypothetical protein
VSGCTKWAVCTNRWSHCALRGFFGVRPSLWDRRIVSERRAALATTRLSRAKAISPTGGDSASMSSPTQPTRARFARKTEAGLIRPTLECRSCCGAFRLSLALFCASRLPDARGRGRPSRGAGWEAAAAGGELDVVSGGVAGAGETCGEGAASTLSESAPGAASGAGAAGVGAGSGAGAPPEPGAEIPPDWARADGAANAVTSSANAMGFSERMELTGRRGSNSCRAASRTGVVNACRSRARRASSTVPP